MSITTPAPAGTRIVRLQGGGLRFLDSRDFRVVTSPPQNFGTNQHWRFIDLGRGVTAIQQVSTGRFLYAQHRAARGFRVVTRSHRDDERQRWRIENFGDGFVAIQQVSSGRFLEATLSGDFGVVTRPLGSLEQTWRIDEP